MTQRLFSISAFGINYDLLMKMINAQPDTLAGTRNKVLLLLAYDFLDRRSELFALRTINLEFTKECALKGRIRKKIRPGAVGSNTVRVLNG